MPAPNKRTTGPPGPGILLPAQRHAAPPSASRHSITADFTKKLICIAVIEMPRFTVVTANMGSTDVQFLGFAAVRYICFRPFTVTAIGWQNRTRNKEVPRVVSFSKIQSQPIQRYRARK